MAKGHTHVGVNYKAQLRDALLAHADRIDILEVTTEKLFIQDDDPILRDLMRKLPVSLHGLDMSLGSSSQLDDSYLRKLQHALVTNDHLWFSDHLSLTKEGGTEVGHLMPMRLGEASLGSAVEKVKVVQAFSRQPFLVENITYYYPMPGSDLPEAEFLTRLVQQTDCGLLLDVNNLYINAVNHAFDPDAYLDAIPLDHVVEIHLAGGSHKFGMLIDTHATDVWPAVWGLFEKVCARTRPRAVIVERDSNFGAFEHMLMELDIAREILARHGLYAPRPVSVAMTTAA
ncbi:hypothetical protein FHW69_003810 [Luteibacter sp. Sphag1AF]|uniref:DUF692 domain-containing protein n=1 Tax=Luteibacter sp. Sphag1AF TaxID=2587031 RepID=UPI0016142AF2|nr:DUF692 domain-containing protein [Luteibacter sp. Sphag1AF]MBB3229156.1 hypothetical protein [Luteibacter sp. Sphag1AF]